MAVVPPARPFSQIVAKWSTLTARTCRVRCAPATAQDYLRALIYAGEINYGARAIKKSRPAWPLPQWPHPATAIAISPAAKIEPITALLLSHRSNLRRSSGESVL